MHKFIKNVKFMNHNEILLEMEDFEYDLVGIHNFIKRESKELKSVKFGEKWLSTIEEKT